jgi:chorismate mutase
VKFKNDEVSVVAQDRKNQVIAQRGEWAAQAGLDRKTFECIYECLINNNIKRELEMLASMKK